MKNRFLAAVALLAIGAWAQPALATVPAPFVATVSEASTNTTSTFGFIASLVQVHNDGGVAIYCLFDAVPTTITGIPIPAGRARTFDFRQTPTGQSPAAIGCLTASSTANTRIEAYPNTGGVVTDFEVANTTGPGSNIPILGASVTPSASATPSATGMFGVPGVGSNIAGGGFTTGAGAGTGTGTNSQYAIVRPIVTTTGTTVQVTAPAVVVCESKTMSTTSATLTNMAQIALPTTLTAVSGTMFYGTTAVSATAVDADASSMNFAGYNLSGTVTTGVGTLASIAQAGSSGSVASTATAPASGTNINLDLSPTYTTIVPTAVVSFIEVHLHSGTNVSVTCQ